MHLRRMERTDLDIVIKIHQIAFQGFFLTRMGPRLLRAYYKTVLDFDANIALVAYDKDTGDMLGFAVGSRDPQGFYKLFSERRRRMVPAIFGAIMRDQALVPTILRNNRRVKAQTSQPVDAVELSSIASCVCGRGIGSVLLRSFITEARKGGANRLFLTTDSENNDAVRRFYERHGFVMDGYELRGARRLCRYILSLG